MDKNPFCLNRINTFIVFPSILFWTLYVLLIRPDSKCVCVSKDDTCDFINSVCLHSPLLEVLPYDKPVIFQQTRTEFFFSHTPRTLSHFTAEASSENEKFDSTNDFSSYSPRAFPLYMLLHLVVAFLQTYFLRPTHNLVEFSEKIHRCFDIKDEFERKEQMRIMLYRGQGTCTGVIIFIKQLISLMLAFMQLILIATYLHDVGSGQMWNWLTGKISVQRFLHNEFPLMANCRLDGNSLCYFTDLSCHFRSNSGEQEMLTTCFFNDNFVHGILYIGFYVWSHIFAILLTLKLASVVLFLSFNGLRQGIFAGWARFYRHDLCFDQISKNVSAFEALHLLQLSNVMDQDKFNVFSKIYFENIREREFRKLRL